MSAFLTRFAPSPTGLLHLGHAFSALTAFGAAQAAGGRFLLRIEDIDHTRCRRRFEQAALEDLHWLGLRWEEPVRRQSDHLPEYQSVLERLIALGVMYRCFKTRREILQDSARAPHRVGEGERDPPYPGPEQPLSAEEEEARLATGEPFAWRLSIARCRERLGAEWDRLMFVEEGVGPEGEHGEIRARPELLGDVILGRKDIGASYHLCCTWDDARQDVTHVIRGADLFASTPVHRLLQALLGLPVPRYRHHPLITGSDGTRLAKRAGAPSLRALREAGHGPKDLVSFLWQTQNIPAAATRGS